MKTRDHIEAVWSVNHNEILRFEEENSTDPKAEAERISNREEIVTALFDRRQEMRVRLPRLLFLKRPVNSSYYRHAVQTDDVSPLGVGIICDVRLEIGALLEVYGLQDRFAAVAVVCHVEQKQEGSWYIGLKFLNKTGKWVVSSIEF